MSAARVDVLEAMDAARGRLGSLAAMFGGSNMTDRYGDGPACKRCANALSEARAAVAELIATLRSSAEALEIAARCAGPDLAIIIGDRAMFARAALARIGGDA